MSLLATTQGLLERTWDTATGVRDLAPFVVGDEGYRRLQRRHEALEVVPEPTLVAASGRVTRPQVLIRLRRRGGVALAIYLPDALVGRLEARPPTRVLDDHNVDDFADFVEEVDHFVALHHRLTRGRDVALLGLETRANVSKALVLTHFLGRLARRRVLSEGQRLWLRWHLFEKRRFSDTDPRVRRRYEEARRLAVRWLRRLEGLPAAARLRELRLWNALPAPAQTRTLAAL